MTINKTMTKRPLTADDRRLLHGLVRSAPGLHLEALVVQGLSPFGYDPVRCCTADSFRRLAAGWPRPPAERLRELGFVIELQAVGPRCQKRWVIAGRHAAQARAYELGLLGRGSGRAVGDAHVQAILKLIEAGEPDYVLALVAELASGGRCFLTALAAARAACS